MSFLVDRWRPTQAASCRIAASADVVAVPLLLMLCVGKVVVYK